MQKILDWVNANGVMSVDWMLCDGIVDMQFDNYNKVTFKTDVSFTKDLNEKNDLSVAVGKQSKLYEHCIQSVADYCNKYSMTHIVLT